MPLEGRFVNEDTAPQEVLTPPRTPPKLAKRASCAKPGAHENAMASTCKMLERRRASRVRVRIPLTVTWDSGEGEPVQAAGFTTEVSRCGARVRVPFSAPIGTRIRVTRDASQPSREFRVIRASERKRDGTFELGLEILYPARNFWDVKFPDDSFEYADSLEHEFPCV